MTITGEWHGRALTGKELEERDVYITVEDGMVISIEETEQKEGSRWICPCFFNSHTHIADTVAMDMPQKGTLSELVAPPNGLKHRMLAETGYNELVGAMRSTIDLMLHTGTAGFADFREGGPKGVNALKSALSGSALEKTAVILGRHGGENTGDGLGISSTREYERGLDEIVSRARQNGKLIAFHAGEKNAGDVDDALTFDPDILIHCTHATKDQLKRCADEAIPIVVCPRSNWVLGVTETNAHPPLMKMRELGCEIFLGTDNAMFVQPDMCAEMSFVSTVYRISPDEILKMAIGGSEFFRTPFFIREKEKASFIVVDPKKGNIRFSRDMRKTIATRLNPSFFEGRVLSPYLEII